MELGAGFQALEVVRCRGIEGHQIPSGALHREIEPADVQVLEFSQGGVGVQPELQPANRFAVDGHQDVIEGRLQRRLQFLAIARGSDGELG
jgi:hypothetical protein